MPGSGLQVKGLYIYLLNTFNTPNGECIVPEIYFLKSPARADAGFMAS